MKSTKALTGIVAAVIIIGVLFFQFINHSGPFQNGGSESASGPSETEKVHVDRVVDGDTLIGSNNKEQNIKIRLIGIDTPETVKPNTPVQPYGKEASDYSKKELSNKDVYLEYDKEAEDQYGRKLAYVWLDKKTMFNEILVRKGLAREKYFAPNGKYRTDFEKAEEEAKNDKLNIWS